MLSRRLAHPLYKYQEKRDASINQASEIEPTKLSMPGATASFMAKSPVFTPSPRLSPIFRKTSTALSPSPSSPRSPLSPFKLRLPKLYQSNLIDDRRNIINSNTNTPLLKRKRPARIDIPPLSFQAIAEHQLRTDKERLHEVEADGEGYAVYCKRGKKRAAMEDRYSVAVGVGGDSHQVNFLILRK